MFCLLLYVELILAKLTEVQMELETLKGGQAQLCDMLLDKKHNTNHEPLPVELPCQSNDSLIIMDNMTGGELTTLVCVNITLFSYHLRCEFIVSPFIYIFILKILLSLFNILRNWKK